MKAFPFFVALFLWASFSPAQIFEGGAAARKLAHTECMRLEASSAIPSYIRFSADNTRRNEDLSALLKYELGLDMYFDIQKFQSEAFQENIRHDRYHQTYKGVEVEGGMWMVRSRHEKLLSVSGDIFSRAMVNTTPNLSGDAARSYALGHVDAEQYIWESENVESEHFHHHGENIAALPQGKLVIVPIAGDYKSQAWRLAYKFDIYALAPLSHQWIYVDAHNGEVIWEVNQLHSADAAGVAETRYSGTQTLVAGTMANGNFRLREAGRSGVETYDCNQDTDYSLAVDFIDNDNYWDVTANMDDAALDAHWGAEMFYDYYFNFHNRNSIDGNGMKILSYVHYDVGYFNAFWNGSFATFGDGTANPLTTLDVVGHEFTHGVTGNSAGLNYQYESGALNESFSDIFGTAIEFYARPATADWILASEFGPLNYIRSMSNPKAKACPDTYLGISWHTGASDNGGVHTNSGVQNKWFYLLTEGGSGTNDLGNSYNVTGIGIEDAGKIAYRNLTVYLTPTSDYYDARFFSLVSAMDIFGACSPQLAAATDAWYAVGIGNPYQPVVTADFEVPVTLLCQPGVVNFYNFSSNADNFVWNFGDGVVQTNNNPIVSHNYTSNGNYTVTLMASGGGCGADTLVQTNYIQISPSHPCQITLPTNTNLTQTNCTGIVYDTGGPTLPYNSDGDAILKIIPTGAYKVQLDFEDFDLAYNDTLYIFDGPSIQSPLMGAFSINLLEDSTITSSAGAITVRFKSSENIENAGFKFSWTCITPQSPPLADFTTRSTSTCNGIIYFEEDCTETASWLWDFGDGSTSASQNPIHTYASNGTYTVTLTATNSLGADAETKTAYITVNRPPMPISDNAYLCGNTGSVTLQATGGGELVWRNTQGQWIGTGNMLTLAANQLPNPVNNFTVTDYISTSPITGGKPDINVGGGGFWNFSYGLIFDVQQSCQLKAVDMYANSPGFRTIELRNASGQVLETRTINLVAGYNKVSLGFLMNPAQDLLLIVTGSTIDLYRNTSGTSYPYAIGNFLSIKSSNALAPNDYFFFYNWEVTDIPCISPPKPVTVYKGGQATQAAFSFNQNLNNINFDATPSQNAQNYFWDFGNGFTATGMQSSCSYLTPGIYQVQLVTTNGGCTDTSYQSVVVNLISSLSQSIQDLPISLFPNPGNGNFQLVANWEQAAETHISLYNVQGQELYAESLPLLSRLNHTCSVPNLASGVYLIQVSVGDKHYRLKYIRE